MRLLALSLLVACATTPTTPTPPPPEQPALESNTAYLKPLPAERVESDEEAVRTVVRKQKGQIKYCYDKGLKENPDLAGRVEIEFTIGGGRVLSANVHGNTTGDPDLAECIKQKAKSWSFDEELEMDVIYPFVLAK